MYSWFLIHRYFFSRIVTFAAVMAVALSVALLIITMSVMEGFRSELQRRIRGTSADIKVVSTRFMGMKNPGRVAEIVAKVPGVAATAPYAETSVLFRVEGPAVNAGDQEHRLLRAVDLDHELEVGNLQSYVAAGTPDQFKRRGMPSDPRKLLSRQWVETGLWEMIGVKQPFPTGEPPQPILIGLENLRHRWILPGSRVRLSTFNVSTHLPSSQEFLVAGYFKTGLYELDLRGILMKLGSARTLLGLERLDGTTLASGVRVAVDPGLGRGEKLMALRDKILAALEAAEIPFVRVMTWREDREALLQAVQVEKALVSIILGMIVLFCGFIIFIILTVQVVEKTRDLGVLQAMGAGSWGLAFIFTTLGVIVSVMGTIIGAIYGVGFAASVNTIQRWLKLLIGWELFPPNVYYLERIPVQFEPTDLGTIIGLTVLCSLLASILPALHAARKRPMDALRYE